MTHVNKTIACPGCGVSIPLFEKPGEPARMVARHNCLGGMMRNMYEIDNPDYVSDEDRPQPAEKVTNLYSSNYKRSKRP